MSLFETGPVVMTCGIRGLIMDDPLVSEKIDECLERHKNGDWGDLCDDDKEMNDESIRAEKEGGYGDSLFSKYDNDFGPIYIITECDRSVTTILLAEEY